MSNDQRRQVRAEEILARVRRQLRLQELLREQQGDAIDNGEIAEQLRGLCGYLDGGLAMDASRIGAMPPVSDSLRGRLGHFTIGILQRLLWWYTRSLEQFARSLGTHLEGTTAAVGTLACMVRDNQREIALLREEVKMLRERVMDSAEAPR